MLQYLAGSPHKYRLWNICDLSSCSAITIWWFFVIFSISTRTYIVALCSLVRRFLHHPHHYQCITSPPSHSICIHCVGPPLLFASRAHNNDPPIILLLQTTTSLPRGESESIRLSFALVCFVCIEYRLHSSPQYEVLR